MRSKTSFFNKTLFLSDIKRYWWVSAAETLLLILACVIPLYTECMFAFANEHTSIHLWNENPILVTMPFSFGTAIIMFTYMHFNGSVSSMHSLPVKRYGLYITKLVSSAAILTVPILITGIIISIMSMGEVCADYVKPSDIALWMYTAFIYSAIIFSLTLLVNMMTGNPIGTVIFTVGFAVLPLFITGILTSIFDVEVFGYSSRYSQDILNYFYIAPRSVAKKDYAAVYPVLSVIFLVLAYMLYRIRKSESHGEVITFRWLNPLFIGIIAALASGAGYGYCQGILNIKSLFTMLPFGLLGTVIAYMISKKALKLKGVLKPIGVYLIISLCFIGFIKFDISGYEKRVPDAQEIASASISSNYYGAEPMFTQSEDIASVLRLHSHLITTKNRDNDDGYYTDIIYELKNGKRMTREYRLDYKADKSFLKPVYETDEYIKRMYSCLWQDEFTSAGIHDRRVSNDNILTLYPDNEDMNILIDALKTDLYDLKYEEILKVRNNGNGSLKVTLEWNEEANDDYKTVYSNSETFHIYDTYTNTIKVLTELGIYEKIPKASDIVNAEIEIRHAFDDKLINSYTIEQKEEVESLYSGYENMVSESVTFTNYETAVNVYVTYTTAAGHSFTVSRTYDSDKVPEVFKINTNS